MAVSNNVMLPSTYNGVIGNVDEWLEKYELIAKINVWDDTTKLDSIQIFLTGRALDVYRDLSAAERADFAKLKKNFRAKILSCDMVEIAKSEFNNRVQAETETFDELSSGIKKLCKKAYPSVPEDVQKMLCRDRFLDAIRSKDLRLMVKNSRPKTLIDAVVTATMFENNIKSEANTVVVNANVPVPVPNPEIENLQKQLKQLQLCVSELTSKLTSYPVTGPLRPRDIDKSSVNCWGCGKDGHVRRDCRSRQKQDYQKKSSPSGN